MLSLYAVTVPCFEQSLGAVAGLIDKAEAFCAERGLDPAEMVQARLAEDMLPFAYQVKSTAVHSIGAIDGVRAGMFSPDRSTPPDSFAGLRDRVAQARDALAGIAPEELDGLIGRDMRFEVGDRRLDFTAEDFLLSFSLPNFYFHVTAAYAILRGRGLAIGKRDYLGRMRLKS